MPNIKSAKKRVRVNATKAAANKARKSNLKTMIKKADLACTENAADKEAAIRRAEGEAEAILKVQRANAEGIRMLKEAGADESVLTLKSLEALANMANGNATKIIVPSNIQGIAGLATSLKEIMDEK